MLKTSKWTYSNVWLGVRVCVQNTPTYNSLTATTHPRGFTFVSAFGTAALPTLDRSDPRDLPFDHTMTYFLNYHPDFFSTTGWISHQLYLLEGFLLYVELLSDAESFSVACFEVVGVACLDTRLDVVGEACFGHAWDDGRMASLGWAGEVTVCFGDACVLVEYWELDGCVGLSACLSPFAMARLSLSSVWALLKFNFQVILQRTVLDRVIRMKIHDCGFYGIFVMILT